MNAVGPAETTGGGGSQPRHPFKPVSPRPFTLAYIVCTLLLLLNATAPPPGHTGDRFAAVCYAGCALLLASLHLTQHFPEAWERRGCLRPRRTNGGLFAVDNEPDSDDDLTRS